jgi:HlyD family secretion protein
LRASRVGLDEGFHKNAFGLGLGYRLAVSLQVDAYPYTVWGLLTGRVIGISADYVQDGDSSRAFKVTIRPDRDHLQAQQGLKGFLKKGMTVNARFFVARRGLGELLYENLDLSFNPAMNGAQEDHDRAQ